MTGNSTAKILTEITQKKKHTHTHTGVSPQTFRSNKTYLNDENVSYNKHLK